MRNNPSWAEAVPAPAPQFYPFNFQVVVKGTPVALITVLAETATDARAKASGAVTIEVADPLLPHIHLEADSTDRKF